MPTPAEFISRIKDSRQPTGPSDALHAQPELMVALEQSALLTTPLELEGPFLKGDHQKAKQSLLQRHFFLFIF